MDHAFPLASPAASNSPSLSPTHEDSDPVTWRLRVRRLFLFDFAHLDRLDLGTPKEFDLYVCDLFERGPQGHV